MTFPQVSVIIGAGLAGVLCREAAESHGTLFWMQFGVAAVALTLAIIILTRITKS